MNLRRARETEEQLVVCGESNREAITGRISGQEVGREIEVSEPEGEKWPHN